MSCSPVKITTSGSRSARNGSILLEAPATGSLPTGREGISDENQDYDRAP